MSKSLEEIHFNMIDQFFKEHSLVEHHIKSVNQFYQTDLKRVLQDLNPLTFSIDMNKKSRSRSRSTYQIEVPNTQNSISIAVFLEFQKSYQVTFRFRDPKFQKYN